MYPQVFGKYVLERELSRGGMARVALATLRGAGGFEKKLVVKQIRDDLAFDSEFVRRFVEEAKTTVALKHANIVPVYELGVEQGTYYLAMELVEGVSITELLKFLARRDGKRVGLSAEQGAYVGSEVCDALDYAHRRWGVVHRDITPRNVMIDEEGQVKLIDFGIAARARVAGHEVFGSPGHMPPEQIQGKELGPPTDIFALAVLLMEAWSAVPPFRRATPEECDAAMIAAHPKPSDADVRLLPLDDALLSAMSLDPRERQQEAVELGRTFRQFLQGVDATDVARALGALVREARASEPDSVGLKKVEESAPHPGPSYGEIFTKTFAARDEVDHWSKPPSTDQKAALSGDGPSSPRKMNDGEFGAPSTRKIDSVRPFPTGRTGRGADASSSQGIRAPSSREIAAAAPEVVETIATRPLETPVKRRATAEDARERSSRTPLAFALVAVMAIGIVFFAIKSNGSNGPVSTVDTSQSATTGPKAIVSGSTSSSAPPASVSVSSTSSAPPIHTSSTAINSSATPPSSAQIGARAELKISGSAGTRVTVDGASRACPGRTNVDPGQHEVRFSFDPTGETKSTRITVREGEHVYLYGDFTSATPNIVIRR